jgi:hypothetical protein
MRQHKNTGKLPVWRRFGSRGNLDGGVGESNPVIIVAFSTLV